jgi:hypothetical protein
MARRSRRVSLRTQLPYAALQPHQGLDPNGLGLSRFARRYLGNRYFFLFLRLLRCFSSAGWLPFSGYPLAWMGCPIRGSPGQMAVCA